MARTQPATFNEPWSDERVFAYLDQKPPAGESADYHALYHAYKHMRPHDFERLLTKFVADGRDVQAKSQLNLKPNGEGETMRDTIAKYPMHAQAFLEVLDKL